MKHAKGWAVAYALSAAICVPVYYMATRDLDPAEAPRLRREWARRNTTSEASCRVTGEGWHKTSPLTNTYSEVELAERDL